VAGGLGPFGGLVGGALLGLASDLVAQKWNGAECGYNWWSAAGSAIGGGLGGRRGGRAARETLSSGLYGQWGAGWVGGGAAATLSFFPGLGGALIGMAMAEGTCQGRSSK